MNVSPSASPATARPAPLSSELMQALEYVERNTWSQFSRLTPPEEACTTGLSIARIGSAPSFHNLRRLGFRAAYLRPNYLLRAPYPRT